MNLKELSEAIAAVNRANGWEYSLPGMWIGDYKVPACLSLIHSEVSEALEAFRHDDITNFKEEMADVIIRVLDLTEGLGFDMDKAVADKIEQNKKRGHRHGGKRA